MGAGEGVDGDFEHDSSVSDAKLEGSKSESGMMETEDTETEWEGTEVDEGADS